MGKRFARLSGIVLRDEGGDLRYTIRVNDVGKRFGNEEEEAQKSGGEGERINKDVIQRR